MDLKGKEERDITIYNVQDLQEIMRLGKNKAYDLMKSPAFPSIKIGGSYIVEKTALIKWLSVNQGREFFI